MNFIKQQLLEEMNGLRGYRNQRFTGKNSFYHISDIRLLLRKFKTSLVPLNIGVYGGFDYGRVWGATEQYNLLTNKLEYILMEVEFSLTQQIC